MKITILLQKKSKNYPDYIFRNGNLIDYSYVNENNINSLCRIKNKGQLIIEPKQLIYHKVTNEIKKVNIRLTDDKNNLIEYSNINLFIELHLKEI
jgi:hypothetical protein